MGGMRLQHAAGYAAFCGALTYVAVKVAWIAGSTVGVSGLPGPYRSDWVAANAVTGAIGVAGAVVALATVRPWGRRLPLWLIAPPMWVGAGLLAPFVVLIPAAFLLDEWTAPAIAEPILEPWVFAVVYGSCILAGAGLAIALPLYARSRIRAAVTGTLGEVPVGATHPAQVPLAWAAAVVAAGLAALRISWVFGGGTGLVPGARDTWLRIGDAVTALQLLCAAAGVLVLVHRWGGHRPIALPLTATWLGAGGLLGAAALGMPAIVSGEDWAPRGQTFVFHAAGTALTCAAAGLISLVTLFLLVERARSRPG